MNIFGNGYGNDVRSSRANKTIPRTKNRKHAVEIWKTSRARSPTISSVWPERALSCVLFQARENKTGHQRTVPGRPRPVGRRQVAVRDTYAVRHGTAAGTSAADQKTTPVVRSGQWSQAAVTTRHGRRRGRPRQAGFRVRADGHNVAGASPVPPTSWADGHGIAGVPPISPTDQAIMAVVGGRRDGRGARDDHPQHQNHPAERFFRIRRTLHGDGQRFVIVTRDDRPVYTR